MDAKTFQPYWEDFRRDFLPLARRMLGSPDVAEDALQECYLRIYPRLSRFEQRDITESGARRALFGWMHQVLRRVCQEMRRRESVYLVVSEVRNPRLDGDCNNRMTPLSVPDSCDDVVDRMDAEQKRVLLLSLMDKAALSPLQRRCLLGKMAGYDYDELSGRLGKTPRKLSWHTYVALKKIRAITSDFSAS
jgi:RNA polymerase sigma factor (sigma-70 family)